MVRPLVWSSASGRKATRWDVPTPTVLVSALIRIAKYSRQEWPGFGRGLWMLNLSAIIFVVVYIFVSSKSQAPASNGRNLHAPLATQYSVAIDPQHGRCPVDQYSDRRRHLLGGGQSSDRARPDRRCAGHQRAAAHGSRPGGAGGGEHRRACRAAAGNDRAGDRAQRQQRRAVLTQRARRGAEWRGIHGDCAPAPESDSRGRRSG